MKPLLIPFALSFVIALLLTPLIRSLARRFGMVARPAHDRWHKRATALLGGIAIYFAVVLGLLVFALFASPGENPISQIARPGMGTAIAATLMFLTGLVDDRIKLKPA